MIPDKIYIVPDFIEGLSLERKDYDDEVCYIRKDALIKMLDEAITHLSDGSIAGYYESLAYQDIKEIINEL